MIGIVAKNTVVNYLLFYLGFAKHMLQKNKMRKYDYSIHVIIEEKITSPIFFETFTKYISWLYGNRRKSGTNCRNCCTVARVYLLHSKN